MKNVLGLFVLILSGCMSSTPERIAKDAVHAASKRDLSSFRLALAPEARPTLGTEASMAAMRDELGRYKHVRVGAPVLVSRERGDLGNGRIGNVRLNYTTTVAGLPRNGAPQQEIYTLGVQCSYAYQTVREGAVQDFCAVGPDPYGNEVKTCSGGSAPFDRREFVESCGIASVQK